MRRRAASHHGLGLSYLINLLLNFEWLVLALVFFGLSCWINFPNFFWMIFLGVWLVWPILMTLVLGKLVSSSPNTPIKPQVNKNPYSAKNADLINKIENKDNVNSDTE